MSNTVQKANISIFEIEELACKIVGLDNDEIDGDTETIEEALMEQLNVDFCYLHEILIRLLPLIDVGASPLTNERYKGFADVEKQMWLLKIKIS